MIFSLLELLKVLGCPFSLLELLKGVRMQSLLICKCKDWKCTSITVWNVEIKQALSYFLSIGDPRALFVQSR